MPRPRQASDHIDELLEEIEDLQRQIVMGPAVTLQDAAVKLRRLCLPGGPGTREAAGAGAPDAVERAAEPQP